MAKTADNSFGSDKSGIVIWKHNTMGHMDNSVEEAIARLVKKQQEGLVNSESLVSFASDVSPPRRLLPCQNPCWFQTCAFLLF